MKNAALIILLLAFVSVSNTFAEETKEIVADLEPGTENRENREYIIGPGDILNILTWDEERLSKDVTVRIDGKISFPLLNDLVAAGQTPMALKTDIEKGLKLYIDDPIVTVTVASSNSKKFYVIGEVVRTNEYPLVKETTVLQAFAIAGGFTEWASKKEILLIRRENGEDVILKINYKDIVKGKNPENNILIRANDTIVIP